MKALTRERKKLGWTLTRAHHETGLSEQQLRNLEQIGHTRETDPAKVTVATAVTLMETFRGLDMSDFIRGTHLTVRSRRK